MRSTCLNCSETLYPRDKYCGHCGQNTAIGRISFKELSNEFFRTVLHVERGAMRLFKGLLIGPGKTATEYVEGKRRAYFNPFTFLTLCIAFVLLMNNWLKPYGDLPVPDQEVLNRISDPHTREIYLHSVERTASIQDFSNKNMNLLSVLLGPYFGCCLWIFFRKRKRNAAEITVAFILFMAFATAVNSLLISPWRAAYRNSNVYYPLLCLDILLQTLYITWGLSVFFNYRGINGYLKVLGALCLVGIIGFIILMIGLMIYVYRGDLFEVLKYL